ncbi:sn-1-specific diacylglycerol lipase ABHD11 isoform X3 [Ascaphus truei]|uniref:sn-1-specific diacylglycerol lipase ABHD11 isoform X3 n=1 Tax=Ascaphus truei TaxID=8439 RepID=UPI003F592F83
MEQRVVTLSYDLYEGTAPGPPLVLLHGLFGSKSNFQSIARALVRQTGRKVRFPGHCQWKEVKAKPSFIPDGHCVLKQLKKIQFEFIRGSNRALTDSLLDDLQEEAVLSEAEVEHVKGKNTQRDRCSCMTNMVRKKGDESSRILLEKLSERDPMLSDKLGIKAPSGGPAQEPPKSPAPSGEPPQEPPKSSDLKVNGITQCTQEVYEKIQKEQGSEIYAILPRNQRKRLALMICNVKFKTLNERKGAEADQAGMKTLLEGLGYQVQSETNLTSKKMLETLVRFAAQEEHKNSDSTFIVLMSHGIKEGICGVDSQETPNSGQIDDLLPVDKIYTTFNNKNCSKLYGKPKVILVQACRGDVRCRVMVSDSVGDDQLETDIMHEVHQETDFTCFYSTTPDTVSWRDPITGSLFIQRLIKMMNKEAHCCSLEEIFRKVQGSFVSDMRQMPTKDRTTLLKKFYLFPGY